MVLLGVTVIAIAAACSGGQGGTPAAVSRPSRAMRASA